MDFPRYLSEHNNRMEDTFLICLLNKQIEMPEHLKSIAGDTTNIPSLVDIIGIEIKGKRYIVKGQAVVMLGPRAYEPVSSGRRLLVLSGTAFLRDSDTNYIEVLLMYTSGSRTSLYATKTIYKEVSLIRKAYPDFMKKIDRMAQLGWDLDVVFDEYSIPADYRECCSGCQFNDVKPSEQFVFKSESEYRRGTVNTPDYNKVSNVKDNTEEKVFSKNKDLECRDSILKLPKKFEVLSDLIEDAESKVSEEISNLSKFEGMCSCDDDIDFLYSSLKQNWRRAPSKESATGRALLKNVLEHLYPNYISRYDKGVPYIETALDKNDILEIWHTGNVPSDLIDDPFYLEVADAKEIIYIALIDYLLGLRGHLVSAYKNGLDLNVDIYSVLKVNPYYFSLIDSRLSIEDLDKLGMFYNVNLKDPEVLKFRNAAYIHNFMLDTNNVVIQENTIIQKSEVVKSIFSGLVINSKSYKYLMSEGSVISEKVFENLLYYADSNLERRNFKLPNIGWKEKKVKNVSKYVLPLFKESSSDRVLQDYLDSGLGIELEIDKNVYITDYTYALKEQYIINRLYELQVNGEKFAMDEDKINVCIRGFEREKSLEWNIPNFKLEERQADAVRLLYNPVMCLTGSAGSGKTTTAEAILYALQALHKIAEENIMFCAPTGRAANRLKEIVKKPTRTIHSLFGIGRGEESYTVLSGEKVKKKSEIKVLIVDESSMINLDLMYNMISKISDGTRIIFLGDRSQLPPIGPGKPFTNLLTFLPCVVLNVPKRASENSGITRNAEVLLHNSEVDNLKDLEQYEDFRLLETPKDKVVKLVKGIVNYHLGNKRAEGVRAASRILQSVDVGMSPDDIQVVTPVNKYEWGTRALNPVLQNVFNPRQNFSIPAIRHLKGYEYKENDAGITERVPNYIEYRVNDRVIHLENMANSERYLYRGKNTFEKITDSFGVMNGDIGKIVDFVLGSQLVFLDSSGNIDEDTRNMFSDEDNVLYMAVKYQDVDVLGTPLEYIIFYKCDVVQDSDSDDLRRTQNIITVESINLNRIDLGYALTVHKLQGSQAKLIIFILYNVGYGTFISRNMIYTAITRAEEGIYVVGNVMGWNNAIGRGRKIEQNVLRTTIADKIYDS